VEPTPAKSDLSYTVSNIVQYYSTVSNRHLIKWSWFWSYVSSIWSNLVH